MVRSAFPFFGQPFLPCPTRVLCMIVLVFAGPNLLLPVVVAAAALAYRQVSLRKRRAEPC